MRNEAFDQQGHRSGRWGFVTRCAAGVVGLFAIALVSIFMSRAQAAQERTATSVQPPAAQPQQAAPRRVKVLFLGDHGHHDPLLRLRQIYSVMAMRGIDFTYTDQPTDLNPATLNKYDCLFLYANIVKIEPDQEKALLDFVESGHGFVPVHCGSACFNNSPKVVALMGGKFDHHATGVFKETIVQPDHPIEEGLKPIESWDETYVHSAHNEEGRQVLGVRVDDKGKEPYTWTRTQGKGRVFYTAWGHDERTWGNADFQNLIERGIKWAAGDWALQPQPSLKPFEYTEGKLPNYIPNAKWGTTGDAITKVQVPVSPAESMQHMVVAPGYDVKLFASEPEIKKPICMAFDERGRLWVAETFDYPNEMQPAGQGRDRITICEDTNGDGVADKFTVFADKLSIPTSMVFANGGVIVSQAPDMLFLKDNNGAGYADERKVLFTGWGTKDTHAGPSNLRWGLDGWIYGTCGYSGFDGEVGGKHVRFGQGCFRFKPDGSAMEFLGSTNNNTWGLGLTEDFEVFVSTANHNPAFYLGIPNRYFETVRGWAAHRPATVADSWHFSAITDKVRQVDQHGGYTAGAGAALYTARSFPRWYWNHVNFVTEPTGHLVGQFEWVPHGAGFEAVNRFNLLASTDEWTAPIAADVGPDGSVWMIDWYNIIVQHNPIPRGWESGKGGAYITDLRDKRHGRVYRITWTDGKPSQTYDLSKASPEQLVAALKSDNMLWRSHAQRLLVEKGDKSVIPQLLPLIADQSVDGAGLNPAAIHALWAIKDLGGLDGSDPAATAAAVAALNHPSAGVRKAALAVLPPTAESTAAILKGKVLEDKEPLVRKQALLALSTVPPSDEAGARIYQELTKLGTTLTGRGRRGPGAPPAAEKKVGIDDVIPPDTGLTDAAIIAAARHDAGFLKAVFAANPLKEVAEGPKDDTHAASVTNLVQNPSFENKQGDGPLGWTTRVYGGGDAKFAYADVGRTGGHSVSIHSDAGVDAGWFCDIPCETNTDYVLSGWIKTDNVQKVGRAEGALLNLHVHQLKTNAVVGTHDWTRVELKFNSGDQDHVVINCLFGGWGSATGTAWYDDIELVKSSASPVAAGMPGAVGQAVAIISNHYAQRGPTDTVIGTLAALKKADGKLAASVIDGLASGWPKEQVPQLTEADVAELQSVMKVVPAAARDRLLVLATKWGKGDLFGGQLADIAKDLSATLNDAKQPANQRVEAARRLLGVQDDDKTVDAIVKMVTPTAAPDLQLGLIDSLSVSHNDHVGDALVKQWKKLTPNAQKAAAGVLIRKPAWTVALLDGVDKAGIDPRDLSSEAWQSLTTYPDEKIAKRARTLRQASGHAPSADRKEIVAKLIHLADEAGDVKHGRAVFEKNCMVCHTMENEGGKVGPELTGIGARPKSENLLQVLDPNRSVEGTFREWTAKTKDGEFISGRLMTETATTVEIIDTTGKTHTLQRSDLKGLSVSDRGVMPEGFEALPPEDLRDVVEYLATSKVKH